MSEVTNTVRWYQAILQVAVGCSQVPLNGNHNDKATREALAEFQQSWGMTASGFLTVAANLGLTQVALEWMYQRPMGNPVGKRSTELSARIREFQRDYGLASDGKMGPVTMGKMTAVLVEELPLPYQPTDPVLANKPSLPAARSLEGEVLDTDIVLGEDT